jgi:hypothetical protein
MFELSHHDGRQAAENVSAIRAGADDAAHDDLRGEPRQDGGAERARRAIELGAVEKRPEASGRVDATASGRSENRRRFECRKGCRCGGAASEKPASIDAHGGSSMTT